MALPCMFSSPEDTSESSNDNLAVYLGLHVL